MEPMGTDTEVEEEEWLGMRGLVCTTLDEERVQVTHRLSVIYV